MKELLLSYNIFIENEYFDKYVDLITTNKNTKKEKYCTQSHHIIPRSYFRYNNLEIENSENNKINLLHKDHVLAHYYLSQCLLDKKLANAQLYAVRRLIGKISTEEELLDLLPEYQVFREQVSKAVGEIHRGKHVSPETCTKMSNSAKGRVPWNKGLKGVIHDSDEQKQVKSDIQKRIWQEHKDDKSFRTRGRYEISEQGKMAKRNTILHKKLYHSIITNKEKYFALDDIIPEEYVLGRCSTNIESNRYSHTGKHNSEESKIKNSKAHTGRHCYTDGHTIIKSFNCPEGFWLCTEVSNRHWYNDGKINLMFIEGQQPKNFIRGRLEYNKENK